MTIETINKRIENAQKKLDKAEAKMKRIEKAAASNYEQNNPYYYSDYDMRSTKRDIETLKASIEDYQKMLTAENDKAASRNVPVLVDFLNAWRDNAKNWYDERRNSPERKTLKKKCEKTKKAYYDFDHTRWGEMSKLRTQIAEEIGSKSEYSDEVESDPRFIKFKKRDDAKEDKLRAAMNKAYEDYKDAFAEIDDMEDTANYAVQKAHLDKMEAEYKSRRQKWVSWEHHVELTTAQKNKAWNTYIDKLLQKEWNRKYDRLLDDVIRITGTIDDASMLRINEKGDLDGFVTGKKGTARVNTFGAGGYNIQCFHYRTKVTRVK